MCEKPYTKEDLYNFLKELLGITTIPFLIQRQIRDYITKRGWNYKGIARALSFLVDERHFNLLNSYEQYGIGIITSNEGEPYNAAQRFFEKLKQEQQQQEKRQKEIIENTKKQAPIIYCGKADTKRQTRKKMIDISSL